MSLVFEVSAILVLLSLLSQSFAQSPTRLTTSATTSSHPETHTVTVGKGTNAYSPDSIQALPGDLIVFEFFPTNHSVVKAAYGSPCVPYEDIVLGGQGFFSGHFPLDESEPNPPTWNLTVNDTQPVFFYCSAVGSCINYQMVGVINPNSSQVLATQKALAKSSDYMLEPGQPFPQEAASSISSIAATATATVTAAFTEGTQGSEPMTMTNSHSGLSGGAIAGIVIGVLAVLLLAAALFFYLGRAKSLKQALAYSTTKANNNNARSSQPPPSARDMTYSPEPAFPSPFPYKADTPAYHRHTPSSYDVPPYSVAVSKSPDTTIVDLDSVAGGGSPRLSSRSFGPGPRYTPTATDMGGFYPSSHGDPISLSDAMSRSRTSSPSGALFAEVGLTAAGSQRSSRLGPHEMDAS